MYIFFVETCPSWFDEESLKDSSEFGEHAYLCTSHFVLPYSVLTDSQSCHTEEVVLRFVTFKIPSCTFLDPLNTNRLT